MAKMYQQFSEEVLIETERYSWVTCKEKRIKGNIESNEEHQVRNNIRKEWQAELIKLSKEKTKNFIMRPGGAYSV